MPSWWLNGRASTKLIEDTARIVQEQQQRNAEARKFNVRATRKKLRKLGVKLTELIRCKWT
jgi:hypothetical protein